MFGYNPVQAPQDNSDESKKLRQQMDEMLAVKPETVLEKILMKENLQLKAEVERLNKQILAERKDAEVRVAAADQAGSERASRIYQSHWPSLYR